MNNIVISSGVALFYLFCGSCYYMLRCYHMCFLLLSGICVMNFLYCTSFMMVNDKIILALSVMESHALTAVKFNVNTNQNKKARL